MKKVSEVPASLEPIQEDEEKTCEYCGKTATQVACAQDNHTARIPCCDRDECAVQAQFVASLTAIGPPDPQ